MAKNQILMSSSYAHVFVDNVQECSYDEFSSDHVVIFIDHFLTMFCALYIINISCLNAIFLMSFITPNNKQNETFNIYGFKTTKGIKICSHNVNRMESKFDETKNNVLQSKYPPDIIGFCETIFHEYISNDSLNINVFVQERKDKTAKCGGGWYISQNLEYKRKLDLERSNIETMWFEIKPCHKRSCLLCFVCRKPSELVEWIDKFESELSNAISFNSDIVLTGDFNMNCFAPPPSPFPYETSQK